MKLDKRMEEVEANNSDSNCWGTALFLIGEKSQDKYISRRDAQECLRKYTEIQNSERGALVVFDDGDHIGVITSIEPLKMVHRPGKGELCVDDNALRYLASQNIGNKGYRSLRYFTPN